MFKHLAISFLLQLLLLQIITPAVSVVSTINPRQLLIAQVQGQTTQTRTVTTSTVTTNNMLKAPHQHMDAR